MNNPNNPDSLKREREREKDREEAETTNPGFPLILHPLLFFSFFFSFFFFLFFKKATEN
jgi:hypothetical protein